MKYYRGRDNLACTIFVPFKCGNNCAFCNTKQMYDNFKYSDEYLEKILHWIDVINDNENVREFVLTGGEPFFNLELTKQIVNHCEKKVYINTTLPNLKNIDEIINYINIEDKIHGIKLIYLVI